MIINEKLDSSLLLFSLASNSGFEVVLVVILVVVLVTVVAVICVVVVSIDRSSQWKYFQTSILIYENKLN